MNFLFEKMAKNKEQYSLDPHEYSMYIYREPCSEGLMVLYTVYSQEQCIIEHVSKKNALKMYASLDTIKSPCLLIDHNDVIIKLHLDSETVHVIKKVLASYYNL